MGAIETHGGNFSDMFEDMVDDDRHYGNVVAVPELPGDMTYVSFACRRDSQLAKIHKYNLIDEFMSRNKDLIDDFLNDCRGRTSGQNFGF